MESLDPRVTHPRSRSRDLALRYAEAGSESLVSVIGSAQVTHLVIGESSSRSRSLSRGRGFQPRCESVLLVSPGREQLEVLEPVVQLVPVQMVDLEPIGDLAASGEPHGTMGEAPEPTPKANPIVSKSLVRTLHEFKRSQAPTGFGPRPLRMDLTALGIHTQTVIRDRLQNISEPCGYPHPQTYGTPQGIGQHFGLS